MRTSTDVSVGAPMPNVNGPHADQIVAALSAAGQPSTVQYAQRVIAAAFGFFSYKTMLEVALTIYQEERPIDRTRATFTGYQARLFCRG